jgi:pimeloyl-ACP methyl ester carboxylesterase
LTPGPRTQKTSICRRFTNAGEGTRTPDTGDHDSRRQAETFAVPASGTPLFQVATENFNPWTEVKVDTKNPDRGPLLVISGEKDTTAPGAMAEGIFKKQKRNPGVTELVEIPDRGHALVIDSGWRDVAGTALAFVQRFA